MTPAGTIRCVCYGGPFDGAEYARHATSMTVLFPCHLRGRGHYAVYKADGFALKFSGWFEDDEKRKES